jgi:tRNA-2-methylthio-N6-dimethylallyladenosine synthase
MDVLFEKPGRRAGQITGKSPYLQPVQVDAPEALIGTIASVRIEDTIRYSLFGTLTTDPVLHAPQRAGLAALEA